MDIKVLGIDDISNIVGKVMVRQEKYEEELHWSIGVVLLNYGDGEVEVSCIRGEWKGTKSQLPHTEGIPRCPSGHPLIETSKAPKLALVYEEG